MKIYLSEFKVLPEFSKNRTADFATGELVSFFSRHNIDHVRSDKFTDYQTIEENIINSDLLIALIDEYWTSSTWKLHEVLFAIGDYKGMGVGQIIPKPADVILFYAEDISIPILNNIVDKVTSYYDLDELLEHIDKIA